MIVANAPDKKNARSMHASTTIMKVRYKDMTREQFETNTNFKMTYEEFQKCDCTQCGKKDCSHRETYRRMPRIDGGLGLCPNLKQS